MEIKNHSKYYKPYAADILKKILFDNIEDIDMYVEQIIICDDDDLANEVRKFNPNKGLTNLTGCSVEGKTIRGSFKSIIFISTVVIKGLLDKIIITDEEKIIFNDESLVPLKTIFHEVGHAVRISKHGEFRLKRFADSYFDMLNEHWKILQDEYYAESYCSNLLKIKQSLSWYGNFNDEVESKNFLLYFSEYIDKENNPDGAYAFYMLNHYYFIPLFQKAGFLHGAKYFIRLKNIKICQTVKEIQNLMTEKNTHVPQEFNSIILKKWNEFRIGDLLSRN